MHSNINSNINSPLLQPGNRAIGKKNSDADAEDLDIQASLSRLDRNRVNNMKVAQFMSDQKQQWRDRCKEYDRLKRAAEEAAEKQASRIVGKAEQTMKEALAEGGVICT